MKTLAPLDPALAGERVLGWQTKLHRWAGQDELARFGDLFNLVCDPATLLVAWERVKRNRGSRTAGVDGQTRARVEQIGVEGVLAGLRQELKNGTYRPLPARERLIPKRSGKLRSLGISTVRDRIVQTAAKLVLEPIFEADFCPTSYGFRPGRRAQDAIEEVRFFINAPRSYEWVIEGDVEDCFGSIHHGLVMEQVRRRVTDKRVLAADPALPRRRDHARAWLPGRHAIGHATGVGTVAPAGQHCPLGTRPPLRGRVDSAALPTSVRVTGPQGRPSYRMIRYADDFVVLVRGTQAQAHAIKEQTAEFMREHMRLTLSPEKTCVTHVDDGFDLLGFRVKRRPGREPKRVAYTFPSQRALRAVMHRIKTLTNRSTVNLSLDRADPCAQPHPARMGQLLSPRREQPMLRVSQPLPVVARDPLAAQEVPAADLETDQATVLGAPLDQPRRHEARLARRGPGDPIPLSRPPRSPRRGRTPEQDEPPLDRTTAAA